MKKLFLAFALSAIASFNASAAYIQPVNGAELVGSTVTVTYTSGFFDTVDWMAISPDGGVANLFDFWDLSLDGDSFGNGSFGVVQSGLFMFVNRALSVDIESITFTLAPGLVFDILNGVVAGDETGPGRELFAYAGTVGSEYDPALDISSLGTFSGFVGDGLATVLTFDYLISPGEAFWFLTDIDAEVEVDSVSAPSTFLLMGLSLAGLGFSRRKLFK